MKDIKTTVAAVRKKSPEEIDRMVKDSGNPMFMKRMLEEIRLSPVESGEAAWHIFWSWSSKSPTPTRQE